LVAGGGGAEAAAERVPYVGAPFVEAALDELRVVWLFGRAEDHWLLVPERTEVQVLWFDVLVDRR
jgi:hypothetical protein